MQRTFALFSAFLLASTLPSAAQKQWTITDIFARGGLTGRPPAEMTWSPDGTHASFFGDTGDLMEMDTATGKSSKLLGRDKLSAIMNVQLTETDRDHRARYGEPDYFWSPDSSRMLFDTNGTLWMYDLKSATGTEVGNTGQGSGDDPKFSPDGKSLSYLHDHNLYVSRPSAQPIALTSTHDATILNGEVDWIYLEELDVRSNYFWSPDSKALAYLQVNEAAVPQYPIVDWVPTHATVDQQRSPQPGDPNPSVRVGVVTASGGKTVWLKIPMDEGNGYIPRFGWIDPRTVWVETLSRDHQHLDIYFADAHTGDVRKVLAQTDDKFFSEHYDVHFYAPGEFLITSWRDGHSHIYRYTYDANSPMSADAQLAKQLESGEYEARNIQSIDVKSRTVYYLSNEGDPREQQLWSIKLDGSGKRQVTSGEGWHSSDFAKGTSTYIDSYSNIAKPSNYSLCHAETGCKSLWEPKAITDYTMTKPEMLELKAADGKTVLYATLLLPPNATTAGSVPLINNPYGGPGSQTVRNAWDGASYYFDLLLAQHGFAVLHVDNRGMDGRGRDFEQASYRNFGPVQLSDQMAAIDQVLQKYPQLDKNRLGWWGWSWGGTFTLNAMAHSDRIRAGVAVAPVTDFKNYDSIYTERYLGLPAQNVDAYKDASVQESAKNLKGHLLLVHGTSDDNVHFSNSIQYIEKLVNAKVPYDFQPYPRKTHSIAGPVAHTHLFERILWHFETYLKPEGGKQ